MNKYIYFSVPKQLQPQANARIIIWCQYVFTSFLDQPFPAQKKSSTFGRPYTHQGHRFPGQFQPRMPQKFLKNWGAPMWRLPMVNMVPWKLKSSKSPTWGLGVVSSSFSPWCFLKKIFMAKKWTWKDNGREMEQIGILAADLELRIAGKI